MSDISKQLGQRIRLLRENLGISQEKLAEKANLNTSFVGQIERGGKKPTLETLEKIVNALDISFEELFAFERDLIKHKDTLIANKIAFELHGRSQDEQEAVLSLVKQILKFRDNGSR